MWNLKKFGVKGFAINSGLQYKTKLTDNVNIHLGANFDLESDLDTEDEEYIYSLSVVSGEIPRDTLLTNNGNGILKSPLKTSLGIGFGKENKWFAGIDYSFQDALQLQGNIYNNFTKIAYDSYSKISIGGFYTPKFSSITSYWERVIYRAGLKFVNTGLAVDATGNGSNFTSIKDFGISFGVGLPLGGLSNVNVGLEISQRGQKESGLLQETLIGFLVGLSLNDVWFIKRKYN